MKGKVANLRGKKEQRDQNKRQIYLAKVIIFVLLSIKQPFYELWKTTVTFIYVLSAFPVYTTDLCCMLYVVVLCLPAWAGSLQIFWWAPEQGCHRRDEWCVRWPEVGKQRRRRGRRGRKERKGRRGRWSGSPGCGRGFSLGQASLAPWPGTSAGTHPKPPKQS